MRAFAKVVANARERGLRIQHYTIESNHLHIICEADDNDGLKRGMQSMKASIVWALRKVFMFHGEVFSGRYFMHMLRTPTEMRNALRYVLFNHSKHSGRVFFADVFSSIFAFEDPQAFANFRMEMRPSWFAAISFELSKSRTWMQNCGWRKAR